MKNPLIAEKVQDKSSELIEEFRKHRDEFITANPTMTDERKIFEGWAIQKIAGLHCLVLDLVDKVGKLESRR
jgi:hypothetical protein